MAFECLTGVLPFDGTSLIEIFARIQAARHLPVRELAPELPAEFEGWFAMACALDPTTRFRSASVAVRALAVALESAPWDNDRPSLAATGSNPSLGEDSAPTSVPLTTLSSARLLARRPRDLGDTRASLSRPVTAAASVASSPVPPPPSERPSIRTPLASLRPPKPRPPWALAAFAAFALLLAGAFLAWRALATPHGAAPLVAPAADVLAPAR